MKLLMLPTSLCFLAIASEAQPVACAFTIICAPEIECEAHEGIPFEIAYENGAHWIEVDGQDVVGSMLSPPPNLTLSFVTNDETLLFSLSGEDGALTRHHRGPGDRLTVASFLGPCVTA